MIELFGKILSVGFDIDQTMYPVNKNIDERIQKEIAKKILEKKSDFKNLEEAWKFSEKRYVETGSRSLVLGEVGYSNPGGVLHDCLSDAKVIDLIKKDDLLQNILEKISNKYDLFLITNNPEQMAIQKLNSLGVNPSLFKLKCYGDSMPGIKKVDGSLFKYFLNHSKYKPSQHLYVGDSRRADILPAKNLEMKTIAVGKNIVEADLSIEKIHEIEKILL
ncbi:HAD family hydrolase [archaeon]|jgi:FMN phosphatase YigB (HAD superfamily)|nr:HAD family hydrolase [archaeon]